MLNRRQSLVLMGSLIFLHARPALARPSLAFDELYAEFGVLGLRFSDKIEALKGEIVSMQGFMAPPLKAEADFFVLTQVPVSICPFCASDADWPDDIVVVYLRRTQTFEQANGTIEVTGRLEAGSWTDPETGFVSLLRISDASFRRA